MVTFKPKLFGPFWAEYDGSKTIRFGHSGQPGTELSFAANSPVDTLLVSLAHCIVMSIQWCAVQHKVDLAAFKVEVLGKKALDEPGRLQTVDAVVVGQLVADTELAHRIVQEAKTICTVSNSLNCEVIVSQTDQGVDSHF